MKRTGRPNQPQRDLIIEGLSTGMVTRSIDKLDDWTNEPVPIANAPKAGDLPELARLNKLKAEQKQAKLIQRTTQAMNKALSVGMPSQFAQPEFKPFRRRV